MNRRIAISLWIGRFCFGPCLNWGSIVGASAVRIGNNVFGSTLISYKYEQHSPAWYRDSCNTFGLYQKFTPWFATVPTDSNTLYGEHSWSRHQAWCLAWAGQKNCLLPSGKLDACYSLLGWNLCTRFSSLVYLHLLRLQLSVLHCHKRFPRRSWFRFLLGR